MQTRRDSKQLHGFKTTTKRCKNVPQTDKATNRHQTTTNNNNYKDTCDDHKETMNTETQNDQNYKLWEYKRQEVTSKEPTISLMRYKSFEFVLCLYQSGGLTSEDDFYMSVPKSPLSDYPSEQKQSQQIITVG